MWPLIQNRPHQRAKPCNSRPICSECFSKWMEKRDKNICAPEGLYYAGRTMQKFRRQQLKPSYQTCDGFNLTFQNESPLDNITSYYWDFGDPKMRLTHQLTQHPNILFQIPALTRLRLLPTGAAVLWYRFYPCKGLPGFIPDFKVTGSCSINPYTFIDLTTSKYGFVDSWHWNFGDISTTSDTSILRNATYLYPSAQDVDVQLIVTNSKGCTDTIAKQVTISDKPAILLPFDTLICVKDTLQLHASTVTGTGTFSWSPLSSIDNPNIPDPFVYPVSTTNYIVAVNEKGCINSDTVTVNNGYQRASLNIGADTTICLTDGIRLNQARTD